LFYRYYFYDPKIGLLDSVVFLCGISLSFIGSCSSIYPFLFVVVVVVVVAVFVVVVKTVMVS